MKTFHRRHFAKTVSCCPVEILIVSKRGTGYYRLSVNKNRESTLADFFPGLHAVGLDPDKSTKEQCCRMNNKCGYIKSKDRGTKQLPGNGKQEYKSDS